MSGRTRIALGLAAAISAAAYTLPVIGLWKAAGRALPAWSSPDSYIYLNLSRLARDDHGLVRNPWYGTMTVANRVTYLRFGLALRLFHLLSGAVGGDAIALIVWHLILTLAIALALIWLLLPVTRDTGVLVMAFVVVMFVDPTTAMRDVGQIRTGHFAWLYGFPFARAFYPQIAIPMLFGAMGAMLRWFDDSRNRWLVLIGALQFLALQAFPFAAVVIMATFTMVAVIRMTAPTGRRLAPAATLVVSSLILDGAWFFVTGRGIDIPGRQHLLTFDLSHVQSWRTVALPLLIGMVLLAVRQLPIRVRAVLSAFAVSVGLLPSLDVFISPGLQFGHHVRYFYGTVFSMTIVALMLAIEAMASGRRVAWVAWGGTAFLLFFAILEARATWLFSKPYNVDNGRLARALRALHTDAADVVVVPTHGFRTTRPPNYWEASWLPLVSGSTILFSRGADFVLPSGSPEQLDRLVTYLFLLGETKRSVAAILSTPEFTSEQGFLAAQSYAREHFLYTSERDATLAMMRTELLPRMEAMERLPQDPVLSQARRVIVADYRDQPLFRADRIDDLLTIDGTIDTGAWRIRVGHPRRSKSPSTP